MLVASVLLERHQHLSADAVLKRLRDMGNPVSKATVYNSLSLFVERGLIKAISIVLALFMILMRKSIIIYTILIQVSLLI